MFSIGGCCEWVSYTDLEVQSSAMNEHKKCKRNEKENFPFVALAFALVSHVNIAKASTNAKAKHDETNAHA